VRVFVDCDDTLVLWLGEEGQPLEGQNPYGGGAERWRWNHQLVGFLLVLEFMMPEAEIVIWSGGGEQYARTWRDRLAAVFPVVEGWACASKDTRVPTAEDTCIDDAELTVPAEVVTWQDVMAVLNEEEARGGADED